MATSGGLAPALGPATFIGRTDETAQFVERLQRQGAGWGILDIRGQFGTGRTALARQLGLEAEARDHAVVRLDARDRDIAVAMAEIADQLPSGLAWGQRGRALRRFRKQQRRWLELDGGREAGDDTTIDTISSAISTGATAFGAAALPGVGGLVAAGGIGAATQGAKELDRRAQAKADMRLHIDSVRELSTLLLAFLRAVAAKEKGIVVLVDDLDHVTAPDGTWLRALMGGTYGPVPHNLVIVTTSLAGLPPDTLGLSGTGERSMMIKLQPLGVTETTHYLQAHGITDQASIDSLYERTGGFPARLRRAVAIEHGADIADVIDWDHIQDHLPLLRRAAVSRTFDRDVLDAIAEAPVGDAEWRWLTEEGPTTAQNGRRSVVADYRQAVLAHLQAESPDTFRTWHHNLAHWYRSQAADTESVGELAYHTAIADGATGVARVLEGLDAHFDPDQIREVSDGVADATTERADPALASLAARLEAVLIALGTDHWDEAADAIGDLADPGYESRQLDGRLAGWRAICLDIDGSPIAALAAFDQAVAADPDEPVHRRGRAMLRHQQGRYRDAIADLDVLVEADHHDRVHRVLRALSLLLVSEASSAIVDLDSILAADPSDLQALGLRAWAHQATANAADALADLDRLIELEPDNVVHQLGHLTIRVANGDPEAAGQYADLAEAQVNELAAKIAESASGQTPDQLATFFNEWAGAQGITGSAARRLSVKAAEGQSAVARVLRAEVAAMRGLMLTKAGERVTALDAFEQSIDLDPDNLSLHVLRAQLRSGDVGPQQLLDELSEPGSVLPEAGRLLQRAVAYDRLGDAASASESLAAAVGAAPDAPEPVRMRAALSLAAGDMPRAIEDLRATLAIDGDRWNDWFLLAQLLRQTDDIEGMAEVTAHLADNASVVIPHLIRISRQPGNDAVAGFGESINRDPAGALRSLEAASHALRATARWSSGERQDALTDMRAVVEQYPDQENGWYAAESLLDEAPEVALPAESEPDGLVERIWQALLREQRGDPDAASALLDVELSGPPIVPYGYILRSRLHHGAGRNDEAIRDLTDGLAQSNGAEYVRLARAGLYRSLDRRADAIGDYDQALAGASSLMADTRYERGELLRLEGRFEEALQDLTLARHLDPGSQAVAGTLGQVLTAMEHLADALVVFAQARAIGPAPAWLVLAHAGARGAAGAIADAAEDIGNLSTTHPEVLEVKVLEADLLLQQGHTDDGIALYDEVAVALDEPNMMLSATVEALRRAGRHDAAQERAAAVAEAEQPADLVYVRATNALDAGDAAEAERLLRLYLELAPDESFGRYELSRSLRHQGRFDEADALTNQALTEEKTGLDDLEVRLHRARSLCNIGLYNAALGHVEDSRAAYSSAREITSLPVVWDVARRELDELLASGVAEVVVGQVASALDAPEIVEAQDNEPQA